MAGLYFIFIITLIASGYQAEDMPTDAELDVDFGHEEIIDSDLDSGEIETDSELDLSDPELDEAGLEVSNATETNSTEEVEPEEELPSKDHITFYDKNNPKPSLLKWEPPEKYVVTDEVWFTVRIRDLEGPGQDYTGKFVVGIFGEVVPITALNFVSIARGYKQRRRDELTYKGVRVHRVVQDFVIQTGDIIENDGTGGMSIYGPRFADEGFSISHRSAGYVAMANHGTNENSSQWYITMTKARWLDKKNVVFGKIIRGWDVVKVINDVPADEDTGEPLKSVRLVECGVNELHHKYELSEAQLFSTDDI